MVAVVLASSILPAGWVSAEQYDLEVGQVSATYLNEPAGQSSIPSKIAELLKQIGELQEKVARLKSGQGSPSSDSGTQAEIKKEEWSGDADYKFERNLSFGTRGDKEVEKLQKFLLEKGYYSGPVTGNYLSLTLQAVKKFQKENGVEETGYLGPKTRAVLKSKVASCVAGQDCGGGTIKPIEHVLKIDTKSDLNSWVGKDFSAEFRVNGWNPSHGNLSVQGLGEVPGLSWARSDIKCIKAPCGEDLIYLKGVATKAGVYRVTVTASSWSGGCDSVSDICPAVMARQTGYGKAEFTVVVNEAASSNFPPVINGTSGPTSLKVGESGTWEVKALDPESGSLSYGISWGDEALSSQQKSMATQGALDSFSQTASFSHSYSKAGEYKIVFVVKDEAGLKASASISVLVKDEYSEQGSLKIDPSSANIKVGESRQFIAWFNPSANCDGVKCPKMPVRQVEAVWSLSAPDVAVIKPNPCPNLPNTGACLPQVAVEGVAAGDVNIIATYTDNGKAYTAKAYASITTPPIERGLLLVAPDRLKLEKGQQATLSSFFKSSQVVTCDPNGTCTSPMEIPVEVTWLNSAPSRINISCAPYVATTTDPGGIWQHCSGKQTIISALAAGGGQVSASYRDSNEQIYTVSIPVTVADPNPVIGKLIIVPDVLSLGIGSQKTMSLFMEYPSSCSAGMTCTGLVPIPIKGTWSSSNDSVVKLSCPPMPPCPAGMACIQVMPACTGATMNAIGAGQGTAKIVADYVDGAGRYYLAESLVTVSGVGTTSSSAHAGLSSNQQAANILQSIYEALIGMQLRFSP